MEWPMSTKKLKLIYLILAHQSPEQLLRLVNRLHGEEVYFHIHVDAKVDWAPFQTLLSKFPSVHFVEQRERCIWGDYSITQATLKLAQAAVEHHEQGMTILLSGQDYPLYDANHIRAFFADKQDCCFIDSLPIAENWKGQQLKVRTRYYRFTTGEGRNDYLTLGLGLRAFSKWARRKIPFSAFKQLFVPRRPPIPLHGGTNWWSMPIDALRCLNDYYLAHKQVLDSYFKYTHCSDEIFFQSLLQASISGNKAFRIKPAVQYANWERKNVPLPVTFEQADLAELWQLPAHKLFARKFDLKKSNSLLDALDTRLIRHSDRPSSENP